MSWFFTNLVSSLLLPPLSLLVLFALAFLLVRYKPKTSRFLTSSAIILLWLFSTPYFAQGVLHYLEKSTKALVKPLPEASAIVILGGGRYFNAPEYAGQDTVSQATLARLRYGAYLYRLSRKPILVTGGSPEGNDSSEARAMQTVLEQDFKVPVRWVEDKSVNTLENARFSFKLLQASGIKKIYLVTHAWHMPRASETFKRAGFELIEAPTEFTTRYKTSVLTFIPNAESLKDTRNFIHEMTGAIWYRLKDSLAG
jgi:uncharacterized SAM-binding protein YcdF (DUF218 family)